MPTSKTQRSTPRKADKLLQTKLMLPHLHSKAIQREDLLARLDNNRAKKLILVTAPTGFGKTTSVSTWIASRNIPSAWVTMDGNDNDPARFWTYVCSALRTLDANVGKTTLSMLTAPLPPSFQLGRSRLFFNGMRSKQKMGWREAAFSTTRAPQP